MGLFSSVVEFPLTSLKEKEEHHTDLQAYLSSSYILRGNISEPAVSTRGMFSTVSQPCISQRRTVAGKDGLKVFFGIYVWITHNFDIYIWMCNARLSDHQSLVYLLQEKQNLAFWGIFKIICMICYQSYPCL